MTHTHKFSDWPFADEVGTGAFCTARVAREKFPALYVSHDLDGDWQFHDDTTDDSGEPVMLCLGCVYEADETLKEISDLPRGWSAERDHVGAPWERWENEAGDEEGAAESASQHVCDHSAEAILASEQKALSDIERFGLHVISVTGDDEHNPFTYSIGIEKTLGMPELIIIGLKSSVACSVINACYDRMKAGLLLAPGMVLDGLLGGDFQCVVGAVAPETYSDYMGWAIWLHKGHDFRALQIIFPSVKTNLFPWNPDASESFRRLQPLLSDTPPVPL